MIQNFHPKVKYFFQKDKCPRKNRIRQKNSCIRNKAVLE